MRVSEKLITFKECSLVQVFILSNPRNYEI